MSRQTGGRLIGEKGILGEWRAEWFLRRQGMKIVARRYRAAHGEIDLIARDGGTTAFIEVKYRPRGEIGEGARYVDQRKIGHIKIAARQYLLSHPAQQMRFDVVEITASGARLIRNAF